jgi:LuxR family transcriptional regulator
MSATQIEISEVLGELNEMAPSGYALGFHVQYTTTKFLFQTYKKDWLDYYSQNGLVMSDPIVAWCFENTGFSRWSDLEDPAGVLKKAADYGMKFGVVCAIEVGGTRSMAGFARKDREFTDHEITKISDIFTNLHNNTAEHAQLTAETVQQLKNMSILVTHPGS